MGDNYPEMVFHRLKEDSSPDKFKIFGASDSLFEDEKDDRTEGLLVDTHFPTDESDDDNSEATSQESRNDSPSETDIASSSSI